jgi:acyl-CoA thioester hydrolase
MLKQHMSHNVQIRVYYEDTDAGGIVYYANYLKFCERGRTECLRSLGFENKSLMDNEGVLFVVHHIEADYTRPARLDDLLTVETAVADARNAGFTMKQEVRRGGDVIFNMTVDLACVNKEGRPVRLPEGVRKALEKNG